MLNIRHSNSVVSNNWIKRLMNVTN